MIRRSPPIALGMGGERSESARSPDQPYARSLTPTPVVRSLALVGYSQYPDSIVADFVDERIRKPDEYQLPDPARHLRCRIGIGADPIEPTVDLVEEGRAETGTLSIVVVRGIVQLEVRVFMETQRSTGHLRARARARASSAGMLTAVPASMSALRR